MAVTAINPGSHIPVSVGTAAQARLNAEEWLGRMLDNGVRNVVIDEGRPDYHEGRKTHRL